MVWDLAIPTYPVTCKTKLVSSCGIQFSVSLWHWCGGILVHTFGGLWWHLFMHPKFMHLLNLPLGPSTGFKSGRGLWLDHCINMLLVALEQEVKRVIYYSGNWWCPSFLQDTEPQAALCLYKWLNEACCMKCYIRTRWFTNSLFPWDHCMMVFQPSLSCWTIRFTFDS